MLHIVCVQSGNYAGQGRHYVNVLADMVRRNMPEGLEYRFLCLTDDPEPLGDGIEARRLPEGVTGWWGKLYAFAPGVVPDGDRAIFFDLDTVITGSLEGIAGYRGEFAILRDFLRPEGWGSGVMAWRGGFGGHIWSSWNKAGRPNVPGGDQSWIELNQDHADILQELFPQKFASFKLHCSDTGHPNGAVVVCFHGLPKPSDIKSGWVPVVWKIGGGKLPEIDLICNTIHEKRLANLSSACRRGLEEINAKVQPHNRAVCVVAGGPSLALSVPFIATRQKRGEIICAVNGAYSWLLDRDIVPDAMVLADARPENAAAFLSRPQPETTFYLSSVCDPASFDALVGYDVKIWHCAGLDIDAHIPGEGELYLIGGGSTVGLRAVALMYHLGYRRLTLYGFDSSVAEAHHAYPQPMNDGDRFLTAYCGDREFLCAPWMLAQVSEFEDFTTNHASDAVFQVAGDGLLPHKVRLDAAAAAA